jgi:Fe-S-cluster-containing hydrogenase component 2
MIRDEDMGRVKINDDLCIGCRFCVAVCPFGAVAMDHVSEKVIKCDLCDGDPTCVKFCETKTLQYVDATAANTSKRREAAERLPELIRGFVARPKTSSHLS